MKKFVGIRLCVNKRYVNKHYVKTSRYMTKYPA
jgi:hypothetical protein